LKEDNGAFTDKMFNLLVHISLKEKESIATPLS